MLWQNFFLFNKPRAFLMLYFCCVQRTHRLPGIHYPFPPRLCSEVCLWLQLLSGNHIWICWGRPRWLRNPGHTLIPADLRPFFNPEVEQLMEAWPCQMFGDQASSCVYPADAPGDRLYSEVKLECFRTPTEKVQNQARKFKSAFAFGQNRFGTTRNLSLSLMDS